MKRDLTEGNAFKNLIVFSVPFFFAYLLQTLYGLADLFIIGLFNGVEATTAVSVGSQIMHFVTVVIVGLAMGSTVSIGHAVGAKDNELLGKTIGNTITLFLGLSIILALVFSAFVGQIVSLMSVPGEAVESTINYLKVCFIGIPFITAYNITSSIFRGLGDSKSPMYFVGVACVCNIVLDYIFIGFLGMGATGAALGTTISQSISVLAALVYVRKNQMGSKVRLSISDFKLVKTIIEKLFKIGFFIAVQDGFIQIGFLIITIIANMRGINDAAAVGVVEKIIGILFLVPSSMMSSVSAICSQNIGANKRDRAKLTLKYAIMINVGFGIIASLITMFVAEAMVGIFTREALVIVLGAQYLRGYVWDCIFAGCHFCFSGYFCSCNKAILSFMHNAFSLCLVRIPFVYLASITFTKTLLPMGLATTSGSLLSVIICLVAFFLLERPYNQRKIIENT